MSGNSYRPITDTWILGRPKLKGGATYYGAYPAGFLSRARALLGCPLHQSMLHACGGKSRLYAYEGFGRCDKTLDLDPALEPDFLQDARDPWPMREVFGMKSHWNAVLIDPPYSSEEAGKYRGGSRSYPRPSELLRRAVEVTMPGTKVGILHYLWVKPQPGLRQIALITIYVGFNNKGRAFTVFERTDDETAVAEAQVETREPAPAVERQLSLPM